MAGHSSYELTSEFVRELPESSASTSWQRSVELIREAALDPNQEPRLKEDRAEYPKTMDHPVFWAGYLVADRGSRTAVEEPEEEAEE